eukprot:1152622-Pelagomonas_calceolata.AAC.5
MPSVSKGDENESMYQSMMARLELKVASQLASGHHGLCMLQASCHHGLCMHHTSCHAAHVPQITPLKSGSEAVQ